MDPFNPSSTDSIIAAPDALDQAKRAFKSMFRKKNKTQSRTGSVQSQNQPTATILNSSDTKPTQTSPAPPAPGAAAESSKAITVEEGRISPQPPVPGPTPVSDAAKGEGVESPKGENRPL